ncbi:MAG: hypothetical protein ABIW32_09070 [Terrimesophilobacter sp.]
MNLPRPSLATVVFIAATLALAGCAVEDPAPVGTPTPTQAAIDTTSYIGEVIDPTGTRWAGRDSGGDETTFILHDGGTLAVKYGAKSYDDPNDTWQVVDGVLYLRVFLDDVNGEAEYVGTWNAETSTIDTVMTTSVSGRHLTVALVQQ